MAERKARQEQNQQQDLRDVIASPVADGLDAFRLKPKKKNFVGEFAHKIQLRSVMDGGIYEFIDDGTRDGGRPNQARHRLRNMLMKKGPDGKPVWYHVGEPQPWERKGKVPGQTFVEKPLFELTLLVWNKECDERLEKYLMVRKEVEEAAKANRQERIKARQESV